MYQALYRQYRPKTFEELLGQNHITKTLSNQIVKGNIGHAYLFSGTRGTGKTSAAKIFSRAVNCLDPHEGNPCNKCDICKGILDESLMDVIEMDAASNNSVEDVRDLKEKVIYPPSRAKYKVYIIDEVHMLSKGAFNALLKTLEEPPKHLIFILATTEPERLPQTILSRCQRFDFKRITTKDIVGNMKMIAEKANIDIDEKALNLIARNSDGAMRDALSLLDQCFSFNETRITYEDAINILGIANRTLIFDLIENIRLKELDKALLAIDDIIQNGKDMHQFIKDIIFHFRDLMIVKTSNNPAEIMETIDIDEYIEQSKNLSLEYILKAIDVLTEAESKAKWSTQPRIILEMATIKLVSLEEVISLEERVRRLESGLGPISERKVKPKEVPRTEVNTKTIEEKPETKEEIVEEFVERQDDGSELTLNTIKQEWPKVLQNIKSKKINLYALIMEGELLSFENKQITIGYKDSFGFHKEAISAPQNKQVVEEIISNYFNKDIATHFTMISNLTKFNSKKDDAIKEVVDFFGEDIVEIK